MSRSMGAGRHGVLNELTPAPFFTAGRLRDRRDAAAAPRRLRTCCGETSASSLKTARSGQAVGMRIEERQLGGAPTVMENVSEAERPIGHWR